MLIWAIDEEKRERWPFSFAKYHVLFIVCAIAITPKSLLYQTKVLYERELVERGQLERIIIAVQNEEGGTTPSTMRISTSCVLNSISELRDVGCSPLFHRPHHETDANAVEQRGVVEDSGLGALEVSKSPSDMLCSILASSSAAITSSPELNKKLSSPPKATVASSS